jgi:hypothetical protein
VLLVGLALPALAQRPREHPYLEGPEGPYHGRVVDAETGQPLAGAVAVVVWSRERILPLHSSTVFHAVREALTGPDGTWVLDGRDVEMRAPPQTYPPSLDVYYPGYAAITSNVFIKSGGALIGDLVAGGTVRLPRLRVREERRRGFGLVPDTPTPFKDVPNLMRLINVERARLGYEPLYGD